MDMENECPYAVSKVALRGTVERLSSHPALSRDSQGLPGAGLISVLKAEAGPGPDRYNQITSGIFPRESTWFQTRNKLLIVRAKLPAIFSTPQKILQPFELVRNLRS
ncbi:unnamed protein product [Boreogadus saida]